MTDVVFTLKGLGPTGEYVITAEEHAKNVDTFPDVDCMAQYKQMQRWIENHPKRGANRVDCAGWVGNWLHDKQDKADATRLTFQLEQLKKSAEARREREAQGVRKRGEQKRAEGEEVDFFKRLNEAGLLQKYRNTAGDWQKQMDVIKQLGEKEKRDEENI